MAFRDQSDEALVQRVRSGEREVFGVLVDRYKRGIANFIGATVRNSSEAADLSQETFLRAYAHLGTFNPQLGKFDLDLSNRKERESNLSRQIDALAATARTPARTDARRSVARSFSAGRSGRRIVARRGRARVARRLSRASRTNADRFSPSIFRQHGIPGDRDDAGPLARQRQDAHSSWEDRADQKNARQKRARPASFRPLPITEDGVRCSSCEPLLDSYLEATLRPAQSRQVSAHLQDCGVCEALLSELRVIDALLHTASPPARFDASFTAGVLEAALAAAAPTCAGAMRFGRRSWSISAPPG